MKLNELDCQTSEKRGRRAIRNRKQPVPLPVTQSNDKHGIHGGRKVPRARARARALPRFRREFRGRLLRVREGRGNVISFTLDR